MTRSGGGWADWLEGRLRDAALGFPEAWEDSPWGERVIKVRRKIFLFLGQQAGSVYAGVKLPASRPAALALPGVDPMGRGLGRASWCSVTITAPDAFPLDWLLEWLDESAPKRLAAAMPPPGQ